MMYTENKITSCEYCARCWTNFRQLSQEELEIINRHRYEANFKPSEIIIKQGSPASNAIFLVSGLAKVYMEGYAGKNLILNLAGPSTLLAGPGVHVNSVLLFCCSADTGTGLFYQF